MNKNRYYIFQFRVNSIERKLITSLAEHLQRSQSDMLRFLVRAASQELGLHGAVAEASNHSETNLSIPRGNNDQRLQGN